MVKEKYATNFCDSGPQLVPVKVYLASDYAALEARCREIEAALRNIKGYMVPGNVMPVPKQAKYIVQWIDDALTASETQDKPPTSFDDCGTRGFPNGITKNRGAK